MDADLGASGDQLTPDPMCRCFVLTSRTGSPLGFRPDPGRNSKQAQGFYQDRAETPDLMPGSGIKLKNTQCLTRRPIDWLEGYYRQAAAQTVATADA